MEKSASAKNQHLKSIAASGGRRGGLARMAMLKTPAERTVFAVRNTMLKLAGQSVTRWISTVSHGGRLTHVMGCAVDPEKQFRAAVKCFPKGAKPLTLYVRKVRAEKYIDYVVRFRDGHEMRRENWGCRALIQVGAVDDTQYNQLDVSLSAKPQPKMLKQWTTPLKPGRPRKTTSS